MARTVVIQRGHVPRTTGTNGTSGIDGNPTEQIFNIAAAEACRRRLAALALDVRVIDADVPRSSYGGDVFIAIHCDGSVHGTARGASLGWQTPEGKAFGDLWKQAYTDVGWTGGWRPDNYTSALGGYYGVENAVLRGNRVAIICETGFLTNAENEALLTPPGGAERFALAVERAVRGYLGITTRGRSTSSTLEVEKEDDVPGPRYLIVRGADRGDTWVTDLAVAYPLGGKPDASEADKEAHRSLLVFFGAAVVGPDGKSIPFIQAQLDAIPKAALAP